MSAFRHAVSFCSLIYGLLNLVFWCLPLTVLTLLRLVVPGLKERFRQPTDAIYRMAVAANDWWFRKVLGYRWQAPDAGLEREKTYLVISNHQSWADSFLIQSAISRAGPILKVLVKRQLMWIPVLALIFWAYDFPRLKRRAADPGNEAQRQAEDLERIRLACRQMRGSPAAMLVYPEGTRFTEEKHARFRSPYQHLLPPRAGGFATLVESLREDADAVLDLTIRYPETTRFWQFLSGGAAEPQVRIESFPIGSIPDPKTWLAERWALKDARLSAGQP